MWYCVVMGEITNDRLYIVVTFMALSLFSYLYIYLSVYGSLCSFVYLRISLFICLYTYLSVCLSVYISLSTSVSCPRRSLYTNHSEEHSFSFQNFVKLKVSQVVQFCKVESNTSHIINPLNTVCRKIE